PPPLHPQPLSRADEPTVVIRHINNGGHASRGRGTRRPVEVLDTLGATAMHLAVDATRKDVSVAQDMALARRRSGSLTYTSDAAGTNRYISIRKHVARQNHGPTQHE